MVTGGLLPDGLAPGGGDVFSGTAGVIGNVVDRGMGGFENSRGNVVDGERHRGRL